VPSPEQMGELKESYKKVGFLSRQTGKIGKNEAILCALFRLSPFHSRNFHTKMYGVF
jgi:hypothetical protein